MHSRIDTYSLSTSFFYIILECVNVKDLFSKERARIWTIRRVDGWTSFFFEWMDMENPDISLCLSGGWNLSLRSMCPHERIEWTVGYVVKGLVFDVFKEEEDGNFLFFLLLGEVYLILWRERERESPCLFRLWSPTR